MHVMPRSNIVFEYNSPVEFILVASLKGHRSVVARSKDSKMDLIYYSHFSHIDFDHFRPSSVDMFYPAVEDLLPLCVESEPVFNQRLAQFDDRKSSLTLVWRGVRDSELIKEVQEMLDDNAPLLIDSFESGQEGDVEWLLSPIIAKCSESLSKSKRRKLMKAARLRLVMLVTLAYLIAALVAFVMFFLKR